LPVYSCYSFVTNHFIYINTIANFWCNLFGWSGVRCGRLWSENIQLYPKHMFVTNLSSFPSCHHWAMELSLKMAAVLEILLASSYTGCPNRYRTWHFFNNSNTNEDIATKFEQKCVLFFHISCTMR